MEGGISSSSRKGMNREGALAAAGFAVVLLLVGLPVWWYTTTVYRAQLPYTTIENLSGQLRHHAVSLTILGTTHPHFFPHLQKILKSTRVIKFYMMQRNLDRESRNIIHSAKSISELDDRMAKHLLPAAGTLILVVLPKSQMPSNSSLLVGTHRLLFASENVDLESVAGVVQSMVMDPLADKRAQVTKPLHQLPGHHKREAMRQVPTEPGYDVTLTLMVPEPHRTKVDWDAKAAVDAYLRPVVRQLESIARLSVQSQVLYMTGLNVSPQYKRAHQHYALPEDQLPLTINAIETKLGSFVWTRPSLHFVIYIPREKQLPLQIHSADDTPLESNSFLVPRWGGVMIHNVPPPPRNTSLPYTVTLDSHWIMSTVVSHLHRLLPIPLVSEEEEGVEVLGCQDTYLLSDWQLDGLARARVSAYLANIRITLQSLCELVGEISNMVISDEVGGWVWGAVEEWGACGQAAREGRLEEATLYCSQAFTQADAAFFHPSMLALLYFPDNQKYAIYVPLFLPVSIPVLLSLKMVFNLYKTTMLRDKVKAE